MRTSLLPACLLTADMYSDTDSFHPSMWEEERQRRRQIKFDFGELDEHALSRLQRTPTPYPKEMKQRIQHVRNMALKQHPVTASGGVAGGVGAADVMTTAAAGTHVEQHERVMSVCTCVRICCLLFVLL